MAFISLAWWVQKLSGIGMQAVAVVLGVAIFFGAIFWLRHDARMDERAQWQLRMANARIQQAALRQKRERESLAIGMRAEKNLLEELDASSAIISELEGKLAARPARVVCYPKDVVRALNR